MRNIRRASALLLVATALAATSFTVRAFDLPQHRNITTFVLSQVRVPVAGKERTFSACGSDFGGACVGYACGKRDRACATLIPAA